MAVAENGAGRQAGTASGWRQQAERQETKIPGTVNENAAAGSSRQERQHAGSKAGGSRQATQAGGRRKTVRGRQKSAVRPNWCSSRCRQTHLQAQNPRQAGRDHMLACNGRGRYIWCCSRYGTAAGRQAPR